MERDATPAGPSRLIIGILIAAVLAAVALDVWRRRRRDEGEADAGEDIGYGPRDSVVPAPEPVQLGGRIPPRADDAREDDLSERRRLPVGPYRPAPDVPETEPAEVP